MDQLYSSVGGVNQHTIEVLKHEHLRNHFNVYKSNHMQDFHNEKMRIIEEELESTAHEYSDCINKALLSSDD